MKLFRTKYVDTQVQMLAKKKLMAKMDHAHIDAYISSLDEFGRLLEYERHILWNAYKRMGSSIAIGVVAVMWMYTVLYEL